MEHYLSDLLKKKKVNDILQKYFTKIFYKKKKKKKKKKEEMSDVGSTMRKEYRANISYQSTFLILVHTQLNHQH